MANMKFYMTPGSCSTGIHILLEELELIFEAYIVNLPTGDQYQPEFEQDAEFSPDPELQRQRLARIIQNPQPGEIIVLREGNSIIGMTSLLYTISTALGGRAALLEDIVVEARYRNRGYSTQLINNAIQRAAKAGCLRIRLLTGDDNE